MEMAALHSRLHTLHQFRLMDFKFIFRPAFKVIVTARWTVTAAFFSPVSVLRFTTQVSTRPYSCFISKLIVDKHRQFSTGHRISPPREKSLPFVAVGTPVS
jgi:hypothetical protein